MGMAASQARLLSITARIHDVEYQAQSIQNAKVQLSTQSDQVYQDYLEALDATTLTIKDMDGNRIVANFNNLYGKNAVESKDNYCFKDSKGRLIVSEEIKNGYDEYMSKCGENDPYAFAMYMIDGNAIGNLDVDFYENVTSALNSVTESSDSGIALKESMDKILQEAGEAVHEQDEPFASYEDMKAAYDKREDDPVYQKLESYIQRYEEIARAYQYRVYTDNAEEIFTKAGGTAALYDEADFEYYANVFKQIQANGCGCTSISDYDGPNGDAANDSDFLQNMLQCGKITIDTWKKDSKTGEVSLTAAGVSSDSYLEYTTTSSIDKTALAKAEAEYEHATKEIDKKDKQYDLTLSKLETERSALTTEYESVQKVINDNIERTFGIFS